VQILRISIATYTLRFFYAVKHKKDIEEQDGKEKSEQGQNEKTLDEMEKI
jgi:hypothetical protein